MKYDQLIKFQINIKLSNYKNPNSIYNLTKLHTPRPRIYKRIQLHILKIIEENYTKEVIVHLDVFGMNQNVFFKTSRLLTYLLMLGW